MTRPIVVKGSANIFTRGMFQAPAEVLSAMKIKMGSEALSLISISATPGPIPFTFPEKASLSRSCPAPYSFRLLATSAAASRVFQANWWILELSTPI